MNKNYCIKEGYISRDSYCHYDDTFSEDEYQDEVYKTAHIICERFKLNKILDIGCGSGFKLIKYFKDFDFTGSEIEPTLSWLKKQYPEHSWVEGDFSKKMEERWDVIICSDVIEHLVDPDELINYLKKIDFRYAVISTPEREAIQMYQNGHLWDGPPKNPAHVREWNFDEFREYISQNFTVLEHFMSKNKAESSALCQIIVIEKGK